MMLVCSTSLLLALMWASQCRPEAEARLGSRLPPRPPTNPYAPSTNPPFDPSPPPPTTFCVVVSTSTTWYTPCEDFVSGIKTAVVRTCSMKLKEAVSAMRGKAEELYSTVRSAALHLQESAMCTH
jgi:hypothetical protein